VKYCNHCNVKVDTARTHCPLCFREIKPLHGDTTESEVNIFLERTHNENYVSNNSFVLKLFIFISICAITACFLINYMTSPAIPWAFLVLACIIYTWVLISHTIISKRGVFEKLLFQILSLTLVLAASENISEDKYWLQSYVFPSIIMCAEAVILMITFIRKDKSWLLSFIAITVVMLIASILNFIYFDKYKVLSIIAITVSALTTLGYFTFGFRAIRQEFLKKFHL